VGDFIATTTNNMLPESGPKVVNSPCLSEKGNKWSDAIYFVPQDGWANKQIQFTVRKNDGKAAGGEPGTTAFYVKLKVIAAPALKYSTFSGSLTNVEELRAMKYETNPDKKASFVLDNDLGTAKFDRVTISPQSEMNFNFDSLITFQKDLIQIKGSKMTWLSSGSKIQITLKRTSYQGARQPPVLTFLDTGNLPLWDRERINCDSGTCSNAEFSSNGDFSFMLTPGGKDLELKVYPGSCIGLQKDACLGLSGEVDLLDCNWVNEACVACTAGSACGVYADKAYCNANTCQGSDKCMWRSRWFLIPDGCTACGDRRACKDYNTPEACTQNPCSLPGSCTWAVGKNKCINCDDVRSCDAYDAIKKDQDFCRLDVCGVASRYSTSCTWDKKCINVDTVDSGLSTGGSYA